MQIMRHQNVVVFGGAGFIGHHLVAHLAADGRRVTLVTRRRENAQQLILLPTVDVVEGDLMDDAFLARVMARQDALINLIGILHGDAGSPYGSRFKRAHVEIPERLARAAKNAHVLRFLQMSGLGAGPDAPSMALRSKYDGEKAVGAAGLDFTIFRPSVVFGPGDSFLTLFAGLQRYFPVLALGRPGARFEPVYVGDVVHAMFHALDAEASFGQIYELVGPRIYTLKEIVQLAGSASGHARPIIGLPDSLAYLQAGLLEMLPGGPLMSRDNLDAMKVDNIASGSEPGLDAPELGGPNGLRPTALEPIAYEMLGGIHPRAHLDALRRRAHR
jgi:NADH dehydrogenase